MGVMGFRPGFIKKFTAFHPLAQKCAELLPCKNKRLHQACKVKDQKIG
jgi:hypothetical protein